MLHKNDPFNAELPTSRPIGQKAMCHGRFTVFVHMPQALVSKGNPKFEQAQGLPPFALTSTYSVDDLRKAPRRWLRSTDTRSSYVVGVKPEHGLWFDFNANAQYREDDGLRYDVAVMISVQGVNALTAQKQQGYTLRQYPNALPGHPPQNYLACSTTPKGLFWLDGFRTAEGITRQFVFTNDVSRGVASQIIGSRRTYSIGFAFFRSRAPLPPPVPKNFRRGGLLRSNLEFIMGAAPEVAAGARIKQEVSRDMHPMTYWQKKPSGIIVLNYTSEETLSRYLSSTRAQSEGPLGKIKVGNP